MFFRRKYSDQELEYYMYEASIDLDKQKALKWYRIRKKIISRLREWRKYICSEH